MQTAWADEDLASARTILNDCLVWDNHACMPLRPGDVEFLPQIERMRNLGVDVVSINVGFGDSDLEGVVRMLASFRLWFSQRPDDYVVVDRTSDIDRARAEGKMAITFDLEGMAPLDGGDHGLVALLASLGVKWMLVAYNQGNGSGAGCFDDHDNGLTQHGRAILDEMRRVGMVACCSHTGHRTAREVIEYFGKPVVFSHSNASAIHMHRRNIPDDLIRACASTGGVVGLNGITSFIGDPDSGPDQLVRHLDHMVQLVGPDHVGISMDHVFDEDEISAYFDSMRVNHPEDIIWSQPFQQLPVDSILPIVAGMQGLGYSQADMAKILGGNWYRVAKEVWI